MDDQIHRTLGTIKFDKRTIERVRQAKCPTIHTCIRVKMMGDKLQQRGNKLTEKRAA